MKILNSISSVLVKYIGIVIIIFSVVAFFFPKNFVWMTNYIAIFLGVAMFGMGTTIKSEDFKNILKNPKDIFIGCLGQYTIMPLSAWLVATALGLPPDLAVGVILVGCCPGGTASNVITHIAGGDVSLSVGMTITSTLIAPALTPLLVYLLAGKWVEVPFFGMFQSVVTLILIPLLLGILIRKILGKKLDSFAPVFPTISSLSIILIISGIVAANSEKLLASGALAFLAVVIHNLIGLSCGMGLARLFKMSYKQTTAVTVEVGMQNSGLAVSLAAANFAMNPLATIPGAIFSVWHNISGSIFAEIRNRKSEEN